MSESTHHKEQIKHLSQEQQANRSKQQEQPANVQDQRPGYGNKKIEGPNRPST